MLDILILLLVGAVVASRFFKFKLPDDTRDKAARKADYERLFKRPKTEVRQDAAPVAEDGPGDDDGAAETKPVPKARKAKPLSAKDVADLPGLAQVQALDPTFDPATFAEGTVAAYKYFQECYAAKDVEGLDNLCGPALLAQLEGELNGENFRPAKVDEVGVPVIVSARVNGKTAVVEVEIPATVRVGKAGPRAVRDRWVLARALGGDDPNWELQSLSRGQDA
jgi:predicted lipid-binding transport protein (Tim44 family)